MKKKPTLIILLVALAGVALAAWAQSYREVPNGLQIGTEDGSPGAQIESDGDASLGNVTANGFVDADVYKQGGVEYDLAELGGGSKHVIEDDGTPVTDIAVKDGKFAKVAPGQAAADAREVVDGEGDAPSPRRRCARWRAACRPGCR